MKSIAFFNNKGGVGKTTLSCNIAYAVKQQTRWRTIVIDCDPQCNSTQLVLEPTAALDLYKDGSNASTMLTVMNPIIDGDADIDSEITPQRFNQNRFEIDLLPGHPSMAMAEDTLSAAWHELRATTPGGFRKTCWARSLNQSLSEHYDLAIYDLGPSLGSLNRSILVGCDFFLTPMGSDIFSIVGIRNMSQWIKYWSSDYNRRIEDLDSEKPHAIEQYNIPRQLSILDGFAGFTILQYITKSKGGERRPTEAFERILREIPSEIQSALADYKPAHIDPTELHLGDVPNLYSLVPLAQSANAPIAKLRSSDGLTGGQYKQQEKYSKYITNVADRLLSNLKVDK